MHGLRVTYLFMTHTKKKESLVSRETVVFLPWGFGADKGSCITYISKPIVAKDFFCPLQPGNSGKLDGEIEWVITPFLSK